MIADKKSNSEKIAMIDCQTAGVAGDMILGALIDAGADVNKITAAIKTLESPTGKYSNVKIAINQVMRGEFKATQIDVTAEATARMMGQQLVEIVEKTAQNLQLSERAKQFASNAIHTLVNAEGAT